MSEQKDQQIFQLQSQLEAHAALINEAINGNLLLRANLISLSKSQNAYTRENEELKQKVATLEKALTDQATPNG